MSSVSTAGGGPLITLSGAIETTRLSPSYRLGLIVVAVAMLLLPLLYLAFIVLTGVAVWWHLQANTWILRGSATQWRGLIYLTPAIVGLVLMFFMVKPIMARPARRQHPVPLAPDAEPALFACIEKSAGRARTIPRPGGLSGERVSRLHG
jgi:hypothetical protein